MSLVAVYWYGGPCRLLDTDTYLYHDPYKYLTVPPFKDIHFMSLDEGGHTINGAPLPLLPLGLPLGLGLGPLLLGLGPLPLLLLGSALVLALEASILLKTRTDHHVAAPAGGSSYIHSAAPGGPAAWTIARMCEHMIRLNEQWRVYARNANMTELGHLGHAMMDQASLLGLA